MNKKYSIVKKSNSLIEARYKLNLNEQKFVLKSISMIQKNDENFKEYEISVSEFQNLLGIKSKTYLHSELKKISKTILQKPLSIPEADGELQCNWFSSVKYKNNKGTVLISHDPKLKPYLIQVQNHFTMYRLENILKLKSVYSIRIYEFLCKNKNKNVQNFEIELDELKSVVGIEKGKYQRYSSFKKRVLDSAKKEINSNKKLEFSFEYEEKKTGRKITHIIFFIERIKSIKQEQPVTVTLPKDILQKLPEQHKSNQSLNKAILVSLEQFGKNYVNLNIDYTKIKSKTNFPKYLKNALKNGWAQQQQPDLPLEPVQPTVKIEAGMVVKLKGENYTVDSNKCIYLHDGCLPEVDIIQLIKAGQGEIREK